MNLLLASLVVMYSTAPAFEPTSAYAVRDVRGWKCLVNNRLLRDHRELARDTLDLLDTKLADIVRAVPQPALQKLQAIPIWVEVDDDRFDPCCCYHVSADWLREHGFNPEKERSMEICSAQRFLDWSRQQPWMVLHELAHGFHHREFGYDEPRIAAAHAAARQAGLYDSVLRSNGKSERHYALNNPMEYFAEATEAYFGTNDFYPFVRAELKRHDPRGCELIEEIWGVNGK
jgi:hypothetical protein